MKTIISIRKWNIDPSKKEEFPKADSQYILDRLKMDPVSSEKNPKWEFLVDEYGNNSEKNPNDLVGEIVGVVDNNMVFLDFERSSEGRIEINRIELTKESLPRESTVNQLKKIKRQMNKEIGGDIGDKISDMNKQGANIMFIRNPIENEIESYENYEKLNRKLFKFKEYRKK